MATGNSYTEVYNPETGFYDVVQLNTGQVVASGLTQQAATLFAQDQSFVDDGFNPPTNNGNVTTVNTGQNLQVDEFGFTQTGTGLNILPEDQPQGEGEGYLTEFTPTGTKVYTPEEATGVQEQAARENADLINARQQNTIAVQRRQVNSADWRVRLRLAPQSRYLYNSPAPGILQPLQVTDGVIFPYTPTIDTNYKANYQPYDLTHSNYRGYFYQNSYVDAVTLKCRFTAQDTQQANYLLAVITFFKAVTKMFYGQDAQRGAPPPLVYLSGLGEFQFNEHPCLVQTFAYSLPADVDYVRCGSPNQVGLNMLNMRNRTSVSNNTLFGSLNRLAAALLPKGGQVPPAAAPPTLGLERPTYVPTAIDITLTLLPTQTRQQVSKQFSVKEFANGNLIRGGFW